MPNGLLEAMAYGVACIATRVGAVPNVIEDGINGLLVPAGDAAALMAAMKRFLVDDSLAARLGKEARRTVERRFDWTQSADRIMALYDRLLEPTSRDLNATGGAT